MSRRMCFLLSAGVFGVAMLIPIIAKSQMNCSSVVRSGAIANDVNATSGMCTLRGVTATGNVNVADRVRAPSVGPAVNTIAFFDRGSRF